MKPSNFPLLLLIISSTSCTFILAKASIPTLSSSQKQIAELISYERHLAEEESRASLDIGEIKHEEFNVNSDAETPQTLSYDKNFQSLKERKEAILRHASISVPKHIIKAAYSSYLSNAGYIQDELNSQAIKNDDSMKIRRRLLSEENGKKETIETNSNKEKIEKLNINIGKIYDLEEKDFELFKKKL